MHADSPKTMALVSSQYEWRHKMLLRVVWECFDEFLEMAATFVQAFLTRLAQCHEGDCQPRGFKSSCLQGTASMSVDLRTTFCWLSVVRLLL